MNSTERHMIDEEIKRRGLKDRGRRACPITPFCYGIESVYGARANLIGSSAYNFRVVTAGVTWARVALFDGRMTKFFFDVDGFDRATSALWALAEFECEECRGAVPKGGPFGVDGRWLCPDCTARHTGPEI